MEKDMGKTTQKRYVGNNRYCLEKTLGKGGFGITWLGTSRRYGHSSTRPKGF